MVREAQVAVIGYDGQLCTKAAYETARRLGEEIANAGLTLVTGGLQGVMKAASEGAKSAGGRTVGIVPSDSPDEVNEYCDTVVATALSAALAPEISVSAASIRATDLSVAVI